MSKFSRLKKHRRLSSNLSIDEKIAFLNDELKKTGMLDEGAPANSTSNMYTKTQFVPYIPATMAPVPDSSGVTDPGWAQPGDETDTDTWDEDDFDNTTLYKDTSYLYNPNTLNGEANREILQGVDPNLRDAAGASAGGGIAINGNYYGVAIGYIGGGQYHGVLSGGLTGGTNAPTEASRGYGGSYRSLNDEQFAHAVAVWNSWSRFSSDYYNGTLTTKSVRVWVPYNYHHHYQRGGNYATWSGGPKSGGKILETVAVIIARNEYQNQDTEHARTIVLQRIGLGDPSYYPGDVGAFLSKLLDVGNRGWEYLKGKASKNWADNTEGITDDLKKHWGKSFQQFKNLPGEVLEGVKNIYNFTSAQLDNAANNAAGVIDATGPFVAFLANQISPNPATYENPHKVTMNPIDSQQAADGINTLTNEWGNDRLQELNDGAPMTEAEMKEFNTLMNEPINPETGVKDRSLPTPTNTTPQEGGDADSWRLIVNNVGNPYAFKGNIKQDRDGNSYAAAVDDNYVFTGDSDASVPFAPQLIKFMTSLPGVQKALEDDPLAATYIHDQEADQDKYGTKKKSYNRNMPISVQLPPPRGANVGILDRYLKQSYNPEGELIKEDISDVSLAWASPKHANVDSNERKRWFNTKDVQPLHPDKENKIVNGYHADSKIAPKKESGDPFIPIAEKDILRNHKLSDYEKKEWTDTINAINEFLAAHPEELIHARQRYPKSDPKLAELNWNLDQMLGASDEYMDSHFPENTRLFNKLQKATKKTAQLTDPEYIEKHYNEIRGTIRTVNDFNEYGSSKKKKIVKVNKKSPARFFKKPKVKSESILLKHLDASDLMKNRLKLEEEKREKRFEEELRKESERELGKYVDSVMEHESVDWRDEIG